MGEKATESRHNLGVVSVYVIGHDEFFHYRRLKHLHPDKGEALLFPMVAPDSIFTASYHFHPVELGSLLYCFSRSARGYILRPEDSLLRRICRM